MAFSGLILILCGGIYHGNVPLVFGEIPSSALSEWTKNRNGPTHCVTVTVVREV